MLSSVLHSLRGNMIYIRLCCFFSHFKQQSPPARPLFTGVHMQIDTKELTSKAEAVTRRCAQTHTLKIRQAPQKRHKTEKQQQKRSFVSMYPLQESHTQELVCADKLEQRYTFQCTVLLEALPARQWRYLAINKIMFKEQGWVQIQISKTDWN